MRGAWAWIISCCVVVLVCGDMFDPRPSYHFLPSSGWMNDPNGPVVHNGVYHLFYQYNYDARGVGPRVWGHATSQDLVFWTRRPIALAPSEPYDAGGVWSGSATTLVPGKDIRLVYTSICNSSNWHGCEVACVAKPSNISDPYLIEWEKSTAINPIIPRLPGFVAQERDPATAWESNGYWFMIVGGSLKSTGGVALLYASSDFNSWTFNGAFAQIQESPWRDGNVWECPDLYPAPSNRSFNEDGAPHVLKASCEDPDGGYSLGFGDHYWTGRIDWDDMFGPFVYDTHSSYDYGMRYYASKTFVDTIRNRRVLWGWIQEDDEPSAWAARGWAGVQSLPRDVRWDEQRELLRMSPVREVEKLRTRTSHLSGPVALSSTRPLSIASLLPAGALSRGTQLEIIATLSFPQKAAHHSTHVFDGLAGVRVLEDTVAAKEYTDVYVSAAPTRVVNDHAFCGSAWKNSFSNSTAPHDGPRGAQNCSDTCASTELCHGWTLRDKKCTLYASVFRDDMCASPGDYSGWNAQVLVNRSHSSLSPGPNSKPQGGGLSISSPSRMVELRVFVDHSVVEVFVHDGAYRLTFRAYPTLPSSIGVSLVAMGDGVVAHNVTLYEMASIW